MLPDGIVRVHRLAHVTAADQCNIKSGAAWKAPCDDPPPQRRRPPHPQRLFDTPKVTGTTTMLRFQAALVAMLVLSSTPHAYVFTAIIPLCYSLTLSLQPSPAELNATQGMQIVISKTADLTQPALWNSSFAWIDALTPYEKYGVSFYGNTYSARFDLRQYVNTTWIETRYIDGVRHPNPTYFSFWLYTQAPAPAGGGRTLAPIPGTNTSSVQTIQNDQYCDQYIRPDGTIITDRSSVRSNGTGASNPFPDELSVGAIVGIIAGGCVGVGLIVGLLSAFFCPCCACCHRLRNKRVPRSPTSLGLGRSTYLDTEAAANTTANDQAALAVTSAEYAGGPSTVRTNGDGVLLDPPPAYTKAEEDAK